MKSIRLAMIGCGRAAQSLHLPAAALSKGIETTVLVDIDAERARELAGAYDVPEVRERAAEAAMLADAAVVALPHHLHAPVTRELLEAGLHVLVEKPLALTAAECLELGSLAQARGVTLAVGMIRRSFPAARFVKRAIERDLLGTVERVTLREGAAFSWEVASDFTFRPETGGGVLADSGIHVLDLLRWWFGEPTVDAYSDDAMGGVEAECEIGLTLPSGATAEVELSRTRFLANSVRIEGCRGVLEAGTGFEAEITLDLGTLPLTGTAQAPDRSYYNVRELFVEQLEQFAEAVTERTAPTVGAGEAAAGVSLLERCRELHRPLRLPWVEAGREVSA